MSDTQKHYTVQLRSPSREQLVDIPELSTPTLYADLIEVNTAAQSYVDAKNASSDDPKDWYAYPNCTDESNPG
jgi:hypothetical protein